MAITRTIVKPVEGQSPIVLHNVPQSVELVGDVTGDKGTNEVWDDTKRIEDFEVKITTLDEYSTGKPHKVIKRVDTLNTTSKEWTEGTQETYEASEKTFNLSYKGHERDFEVNVIEGEESEGSGELQYIQINAEDTLNGSDFPLYFLEIEEPPRNAYEAYVPFEEGEDMAVFFGNPQALEARIAQMDLDVDLSQLKQDACYATSIFKDWDLENSYFNDIYGDLVEGHIVPVTSSSSDSDSGSSSSKLYIRYRWGMNDAHDLSVEKNITITERPTPSEDSEVEFLGTCTIDTEVYYYYKIPTPSEEDMEYDPSQESNVALVSFTGTPDYPGHYAVCINSNNLQELKEAFGEEIASHIGIDDWVVGLEREVTKGTLYWGSEEDISEETLIY